MAGNDMADTPILNLGEVADYLRVHRSTIYRLLRQGSLHGFKIGSDWRFDRAAIDRWCLSQQVTEPQN